MGHRIEHATATTLPSRVVYHLFMICCPLLW